MASRQEWQLPRRAAERLIGAQVAFFVGVDAMFGSYQVELAMGLAAIVLAVVLWRYLLRAFRRVPPPFLLRSDMAAEISAVVEIALLSIGFAYLVDGLAKMIP